MSQQQEQAARFLKGKKSKLKTGFLRGLKASRYFAVIILILLVLIKLRVLPAWLTSNGVLCLSLLLFFLAMPLSLFARLDLLMSNFRNSLSEEGAMLVALFAVCLNFGLLGAVKAFFRKEKLN